MIPLEATLERSVPERLGLVHLYCGEGKGKTTAAMGLVARAAGHGLRILIVQFLKDGRSGEIISLRGLNGVQVLAGQITHKFSIAMNPAERADTRALHQAYFAEACAQAKNLDMLVLDEIVGAIETNLLDERAVLDFLACRPSGLEIILTGRHPTPQLMEQADYITRMECVRHPYQRGILARVGIEY